MNETVDKKNEITKSSFIKEVNTFLTQILETRNIEDRCKMVIKLYSFLLSVTMWIEDSTGSFDVFKTTVQNKSYELIKEIDIIHKISEDTKKQSTDIIHKTLQIICCNHQVGSRYCMIKKSGDLCAFHTNKKKKIVFSINETKLLNRDVLSIVFDYIS
jgi:hypothetical protein